MALGKHKQPQSKLFVSMDAMPRSGGHVFFDHGGQRGHAQHRAQGYWRRLQRHAGAHEQGKWHQTPTRADLVRMDKKRKGKKLSNEDWQSTTDSDARIARRKDKTTRMAYKPEHAVDLDTGAIVAAPVYHADRVDAKTVEATLEKTANTLEQLKMKPCVANTVEVVERNFQHVLTRGGQRRTQVRGLENVQKNYLLAVAGFNRMMKKS